EILVDSLFQNAWGERTERLTKLNFQIHDRLHPNAPRIAQDAATAQASRAKLHPTLKPANDLFLSNEFSHVFADIVFIVERMSFRPHLLQKCFDLLIAEMRA